MSDRAQTTFPIEVVKKQPESNGKHKCSKQCQNCPRCSSTQNKSQTEGGLQLT